MDIPKRYLLVVLCSLLATAVSVTECPFGWYFYDGSCYQVFTNEADLYEARDTCKYNDALVAEIMSENENDFVTSLVQNAGITDAWLGIYSLGGRWHYVSTESMVNYSNFAKSVMPKIDIQPTERPKSKTPDLMRVTYAYLSSSRGWGWGATPNSNLRKGVVCKRCPLREECSESLGKCYTLSCLRLASDDAQRQCEMHNGTLAEPKTKEEYNFVKQFLAGKDLSDDPLGMLQSKIYIGGIKKGNQFVWRSSGETIPEDAEGYGGTRPSSMDSSGGEKECLAMDPAQDNVFDYEECTPSMHYICERNLNAA